MPYDLADDLRAEIAQGHVLVVVGTGVSIQATAGNPLATWKGLLENGVERCVAYLGLDPKRADLIRAEISLGHMDDLLSAAEKISRVLDSPHGGQYRSWLRETVGSLRAEDPSVLEALRDLGLPLATTNYDSLLEEITDFQPVTWRDGDKSIRVITGQDTGILHLHGHWDQPDSVVLGIRSYEQILGDGLAQAILRALRTMRTLLFVGCGDGLADPNFGALLHWAREVLHQVGSRHYRLCSETDLATLRAVPREGSLYLISYGADHTELEPFLRSLGPSSRSTNARAGAIAARQLPSSVPRLPARPRCFGREGEIQDLVETLLLPSPPPTPVLGAPGAGKTTIALAALHDARVAARYRARRFFVRCDSVRSRKELAGTIVSAIGLQPGPDVEGILLEDLGRTPTALVLDNAETLLEGMDQANVREFLSEMTSIPGLALVASVRGRERPSETNWRAAIHVGPLQPDAARQAFLEKSDQKFEHDPALDALLDEVDRLALAVVLLGYNAQVIESIAELRRLWQAQKTALLQRNEGRGRLDNIEVSIELSVSGSRMTQGARRLLSVLAYLPDGIAAADLETLLPGNGEASALVLLRVGLADRQASRIRALAPIRQCVRKLHPPRDEDLERTLGHYVRLVRGCDRIGRKAGAEVVARLAPELGNVDSMLAMGLEHADPEPAITAAAVLGQLTCLAGCASSTLIEQALDKARGTGRHVLHATCAEQLGDIALDRCRHGEARHRYDEALELYRRVGSVLGEANCILRLGDLALGQSDFDEALLRYEEALPLYHRIGSPLGEAICCRRLGDIALICTNYDGARARFEEALELFRQIGDVLGQANCIQGLGDLSLRSLDAQQAGRHFMAALDLYQMMQEPYSIGWTRVRLARLAPEGSEERRVQLELAQASFESIKRSDFVEELREEFGAPPETRRSPVRLPRESDS